MKSLSISHPQHLQGLALKVTKYVIVVIIALAMVAFVYPSAFIYPKDTLPDNNDTRLIAYIIGQVQKNLLEHKPLHYGTYFAPDQSTLAYSDLFLTSAVLTLPFRPFTNHPILIFNLALIIGSLLTILSSYLLFEYLLKDIWTTSITVFLFNFSGFHLHFLPHLQMFSLWPLLLSIYFFLRFLTENRLPFLYLFFFTVTVQLAESIFPTYLIFFTCLCMLISKTNEDAGALANNRTQAGTRYSREIRVRFWRGPKRIRFASIALHSLPFIPLWLFLLFPYYHLHTSLPEATRPIRDAAHFSLGLDQIFTQYHSWTVIILFVVLLIITRLKVKKNSAAEVPAKSRAERIHPCSQGKEVEHSFLRSSKRLFYFSLIMSLGPVFKIFGQNIRIFGFPIPLPYTLFYYLFPGFTGFRTPSRFIVLALLAACILIGFRIKPIFEKLKSKTKFIFLLLVLSFLFWEADLPLNGYPVNINMHPVYQAVKNLPPEAVILELPIKLWNMPDHEIESVRSLYSLEHNHRRFGGYSGFATNSWIDLVEKINVNGLDEVNSTKLRSLGITHIIRDNKLLPLQ